MCFFPRNGSSLNDSLCFFKYQVFHFHEVEKYPMICVTSTKRKLIQKEFPELFPERG